MPIQPRRKATIADVMLQIIGVGLAFSAWRCLMWMPLWHGIPDSLQLYYFQGVATVAFLIPLSLSLLAMHYARRVPGLVTSPPNPPWSSASRSSSF